MKPMDLTYPAGDGSDRAIRVYPPKSRKGRRGGILFFHGGGWRGGDLTQFDAHCRHFAERNMVVATAAYRLIGDGAESVFDCLADARSAMRWLRHNAGDLSLDAGRLAAGGGSAGGHLAALLGLTGGAGGQAGARADAMVLFNPVLDCGPEGFPDRDDARRADGVLTDRWRELSPIHRITRAAPPTIIFHGAADETVPVAQARAFKEAMQEAGARCELEIYEGCGHGFFNYRGGDNPYYRDTIEAAQWFLASLGYVAKPSAG